MKLHVKNFQAITDASIEFPVGITCICGESNNGKTALLRAIKALATNPNGSSHYIQHGKDKAEVTLENNGEKLTWERTKSTTHYKYGDEVFTKCSKQSSFDFCDLGFVVDNKGKLLNLSGEWDILFPFNLSDTELFKLFEDLFSVVDSAKILDGMKADETSCNKDKLLTQNNLSIIRERKDKAEALLSQLGDLNKAELIKTVLSNKLNDLEKLKKDCSEITRLNNIYINETAQEPFKSDLLSDRINELAQMVKVDSWLCRIPENLSIPEVQPFDFSKILYELERLAEANQSFSVEDNKIKVFELNKIEFEQQLNKLNETYQKIEVCPLCGHSMKG